MSRGLKIVEMHNIITKLHGKSSCMHINFAPGCHQEWFSKDQCGPMARRLILHIQNVKIYWKNQILNSHQHVFNNSKWDRNTSIG